MSLTTLTVTITLDEIMREPRPWDGASMDHAMAVIMMRKGLRMRASFSPTPQDLQPPWSYHTDPLTQTLTVTQVVQQ